MTTPASDSERRSRVVAVIPARGGSKGIPGKNLERVGGIPLVARAVASARAARLVDRVIVSTDDATIADVSRAGGAEIIVRPDELSGDTASSESAIDHAIASLGVMPEVIVFLQATSPFIDPEELDAAIGRVLDGECDSLFSAVESHDFHWRATDAGAAALGHDAASRPRRQDREPQYRETGAFYVMSASGFREAGHRFFGRIGIAIVDPRRAIDIDTLDELALARAAATIIDGESSGHPGIAVDALVTDFDGVHTDDRVHVAADGSEVVTASRSDGMGVALLQADRVPVLILSAETNPVVAARADKLRVEVMHGIDDKASALTAWASDRGIDLSRIAYLGNDVNDLGPLRIVGWPVAVADAHREVRLAARLVLTKRGGHGAVRELAELILRARLGARDPLLEEESWPLSSVVPR